MTTPNAARGPFTLVTVNTAPERARRLIVRVREALQDRCTIVHAANCERIDQVESAVREHQPDLLFCASMWTADEAEEIQQIARKVKPGLATHAIPHGMQVDRGPDAIVEHLTTVVPQVLKEHFGG